MKYPVDPIFDTSAQQEESYAKLSGEVELKNVTFGCSHLGEPLIRDFSIHIKPGSRLISEESLREMHSPQVIGTPYFWNFEEFQSTEYGLGWFTDIYRGVKMIGHGGNTNGNVYQEALTAGLPCGSHRSGATGG